MELRYGVVGGTSDFGSESIPGFESWYLNKMVYKCPICNLEINGVKGIHKHLKEVHAWSFDECYKFTTYTYKQLSIPKCPICNKDIVFTSKRIPNTCGSYKCRKEYASLKQKEKYIKHPELRNDARIRRLKFLSNKSNFIKTGWGKRANKNFSYLEKWFLDNVINKHQLYKEYDIIYEYPYLNYSLDFAFENIKLDVELDGACHFDHGNNRILHDKERDKLLKDNGWTVYRISYREANEETINNFLKLLKTNSFEYKEKYFENELIFRDTIKSEKLKLLETIKQDKLKKKQIQEDNIVLVLKELKFNSNIDFSKFGWVQLSYIFLKSKNINIAPQKIRKYIKTHYPQFFEGLNVFERKVH